MQNILTRTVTMDDLMNASRPVTKAIVIAILFNRNEIRSLFLEAELGGASTILYRFIMSPRTIDWKLPLKNPLYKSTTFNHY